MNGNVGEGASDPDNGHAPPSLVKPLSERFGISEAGIRLRLDRWETALRPVIPSDISNPRQASFAFAAEVLAMMLGVYGSDKGMRLSLVADVARLVDRVGIVRMFFGSECASHGLVMPHEILADQLAELRGFLEENRHFLLKEGLPTCKFCSGCALVEQQSILFPAHMFRIRIAARRRYDSVPSYEWLNFCVIDRDEAVPQAVPVSREQASLLNGLSMQDAVRIEDLRPRILALKIDLLWDAEQALRGRDNRDLWEKCFQKAKKALSPDEIGFIEQIERIYHRSMVGTRNTSTAIRAGLGFGTPSEPGGLGNLKELLWHVGSERRLSLLHDLAHAFIRTKLLRRLARKCVSSKSLKKIARGQLRLNRWRRRVIDAALDKFIGLEPKLAPLREEFDTAIRTFYHADDAANAGALYEKSTAISFMDERGGIINEVLSKILELVRNNVPTNPTREAATETNVFRHLNSVWLIRFQDSTCIQLPDLAGLLYIQKALEKQGRQIPFSALASEKAVRKGTSIGVLNVDDDSVTAVGIDGQVAEADLAGDDQTRETIRLARELLEENLQTARFEGRQTDASDLENKIEEFDDIVRRDQSLGGKSKNLAKSAKNERDRIKKAIDRAKDKIKPLVPKLYEHLQAYLVVSDYVHYRPPERTSWSF